MQLSAWKPPGWTPEKEIESRELNVIMYSKVRPDLVSTADAAEYVRSGTMTESLKEAQRAWLDKVTGPVYPINGIGSLVTSSAQLPAVAPEELKTFKKWVNAAQPLKRAMGFMKSAVTSLARGEYHDVFDSALKILVLAGRGAADNPNLAARLAAGARMIGRKALEMEMKGAPAMAGLESFGVELVGSFVRRTAKHIANVDKAIQNAQYTLAIQVPQIKTHIEHWHSKGVTVPLKMLDAPVVNEAVTRLEKLYAYSGSVTKGRIAGLLSQLHSERSAIKRLWRDTIEEHFPHETGRKILAESLRTGMFKD